MKIFKSIFSFSILFSTHFIDARVGASSQRQQSVQQTPSSFVKTTADTQQPVMPSSVKTSADMQEKSYKDLVNYVKNVSNAWDRPNRQLNPEFISTMIQKARQLNLDNIQLQSLLETARDIHAIFSGDRPHDVAILNWVNHQIREALNQR
jgi:hypothetical protein